MTPQEALNALHMNADRVCDTDDPEDIELRDAIHVMLNMVARSNGLPNWPISGEPMFREYSAPGPETRYLLIDASLKDGSNRPIDSHRLLAQHGAMTAQEIVNQLGAPTPHVPLYTTDEAIDRWLDSQSAPAGVIPSNLIEMCAEYLRRVRMEQAAITNPDMLAVRITDLDHYFIRALATHVPIMQAVFHAMRLVNMDRCARWHQDETETWTLADWSNAVGGEWGELANKIKKIRRLDTGLIKRSRDSEADRQKLIDAAVQEVADVFIYLQITLAKLDPDQNMYDVIADKFNATSDEFGFMYKLPEYDGPTEDD